MNTKPAKLWDYSLALYSHKDVAEACLSLQNQFGFDVNLVLFCLWYGEYFTSTIPQALLADAIKLSDHWSRVSVKPLRGIRTEMKHDNDLQQLSAAPAISELREKIKSLELQAEKIQHSLLEELAFAFSAETSSQTDVVNLDAPPHSQENLALLTAAMELNLEPALESAFARILAHR